MRSCEPYEALLEGHEWYITIYIIYLLDEPKRGTLSGEGAMVLPCPHRRPLKTLGQNIFGHHIEVARSEFSVSNAIAKDRRGSCTVRWD